MPVPFGIGIGDFIAVIGLAKDICDALRSRHGAVAHYRSVIAILDSLSDTLEQLQNVNSGDEAISAALKKAVANFKGSIAEFFKKNGRYNSLLQTEGSVSVWKNSIQKVRWALFDGKDITAFHTEITAHSISVLILLSTAQMRTANEREPKVPQASVQSEQIKSLQRLFDENLQHWTSESLAVLTKLVQVNSMLLGTIMELHRLLNTHLPPKIGDGSFVNFQDAFGLVYPIHLRTIDTWEVFADVLKNKYKGKPGSSAVLSSRYLLQDATEPGRWQPVDMTGEFLSVFKPGHNIDMTIIFNYDPDSDSECPKCGRLEEEILNESKLECSGPDCDLCYHKSSWKDTWVTIFPNHFEANPSVETTSLENSRPQASQALIDLLNASTGRGTPAFRTPVANAEPAEEIFNFKNVFIARPANVAIRAPSGAWHLCPWRVLKSAEGMRFILENFIESPIVDGKTELRELGKDGNITESNMTSLLYPGINLEISPSDRLSAAQTSLDNESGSKRNPLPFLQAATCFLCSKQLWSRAAFERHIRGHIRRRPCPTHCRKCLNTPKGAFSCPSDCACSPNHISQATSTPIHKGITGCFQTYEGPIDGGGPGIYSGGQASGRRTVRRSAESSMFRGRRDSVGSKNKAGAYQKGGTQAEVASLSEPAATQIPTVYWICHQCHARNNPAFMGTQCNGCSHARCAWCVAH